MTLDLKFENERVWLLIEDNSAIRVALAEFLHMWGIIPRQFEDGKQASVWLDEVEAGRIPGPLPELALIDMLLPPGPQGHEIAQRLRSLPATANMAIVIITAHRFNRLERAQIEDMAQPDLFLTKPFPDMGELKTMLESVLRQVQT